MLVLTISAKEYRAASSASNHRALGSAHLDADSVRLSPRWRSLNGGEGARSTTGTVSATS